MSLRVIHECLQAKDHQLALVICNTPLNGVEKLLKQIWQCCSIVVCADGGSNRLYDTMGPACRNSYIPHVICGDLDSAREEVVQFYKDKDSKIVKIADQDTTDLTKSINHIVELEKTQVDAILVINAINWGRFDQIMGVLHSLFLTHVAAPPTHLLSADSFITLLSPGHHWIPVNTGLEEGHCGLIPIAATVDSVSTTGLTWNLNCNRLSFQHLISTSNVIATGADEVTIDTSGHLIWTLSHQLLPSSPNNND